MSDSIEIEIEIGDIYLIWTKNGGEYEGEVIFQNDTYLTVEWWNKVKDRTDEIDIAFADIETMIGFNDSQTTV